MDHTLEGHCKPQSTVTINGDINGSLPLDVTCDGSGAFTQAITLTTGDGIKVISAFVTDTQDEITETSKTASVNFIMDTVRPPVPTITSPVSDALAGRIYVNTLIHHVSGECEPRAIVHIENTVSSSEDGLDAAPYTGICDLEGTYSIQIKLRSGDDGNRAIQVTQYDPAGNRAPNVSRKTFMLVTVNPRASVFTVKNNLDQVIGNNKAINYRNISVSVNCHAYENDFGLIWGDFLESPLNISCKASETSDFEIDTFSVTLTEDEGLKSIRMTVTDRAGNESPEHLFQVIHDVTPPAPPTLVDHYDGRVINMPTQNLKAKCEAKSTVVFTGDFVGSPKTKDCGHGTGALADLIINVTEEPGPKQISIRQTDEAGNTSDPHSITIIYEPR